MKRSSIPFLVYLFLPFVLGAQDIHLSLGHSFNVFATVLSPNGQFAFSGGGDKLGIFWDVNTGKEISQFLHNSPIKAAAFSKQEENTLAFTSDDGFLYLWEVGASKAKAKLSLPFKAFALVFCPNEPCIYIGGKRHNKGPNLVKYNLKTQQIQQIYQSSEKLINRLALSRDGKYLVGAGYTKKIELFGTDQEKALVPSLNFPAEIFSLDIQPPESQILISGHHQEIWIWDWSKNQIIQKLDAPSYRVGFPFSAFSQDGKEVYSLSAGYLYKWKKEANTFQYQEKISLGKNPTSVSFLADKGLAFYCDFYFTCGLIEWEAQQKIRSFSNPAIFPKSLSLYKNLIALEGSNGEIKLLDLEKAEFTRSLGENYVLENISPLGHFNSIAFSPNGRYLAAPGVDNMIKVYDLKENTSKKAISFKMNSLVSSLGIDSSNRYLMAQSQQNVEIWDLEKQRLQSVFPDSIYSLIYRAALSPRSSIIAIAIQSRARLQSEIILWNWKSQQIIESYSGLSSSITDLGFSRDGQYLYAAQGGYSNKCIIWNISSKQEVYRIPAKRIALSSDNRYLAAYNYKSAAPSYDIDLYELKEKAKKIKRLSGHKAMINQLAFMEDDRHLISGSMDKTVRLWCIAETKLKASFQVYPGATNEYIIFTPEGYYKASKAGARTLHFMKDLEVILFDQYDQLRNRPDKVLENIGLVSDGLIGIYKEAYIKRLKRLGYDAQKIQETLKGNKEINLHSPTVKVRGTPKRIRQSQGNYSFSFEAQDSLYSLERGQLLVNGVPHFGRKGFLLKGNASQKELEIPLNPGSNQLSLKVKNQEGVESKSYQWEVIYEATESDATLYLICIGVKDYTYQALDLSYPVKDARDLVQVFSNSELYQKIQVDTLFDQDFNLKNLKRIQKKLNKSQVQDQVIISYAGHGFRNQKGYFLSTSNIDPFRPQLNGIPYTALENLLDGIPARKKLMLIDACYSGEAEEEGIPAPQQIKIGNNTLKSRGFKLSPSKTGDKSGDEDLDVDMAAIETISLPNSFQLMKEIFNDIRNGTGATIIAAAGNQEVALEGDLYSNGLFTFCLLSGLKEKKADLDQDGIIRISELKRYVQDSVLTYSKGAQRPSSRIENMRFDYQIW